MDIKPTPTKEHKKSHHHDKAHKTDMIVNGQATTAAYAPATATLDKIPTETWGPFTICVVIFLVILTCFILNCNRIRRKVDEHRMNRHGKSGPFSFEKRHKDLQEADLEWNVHPPIVFTSEKLSTPESTYSSKGSSIAQKHHYQDENFMKTQPPSVQLRLTLEEASAAANVTTIEPARTLNKQTNSLLPLFSTPHQPHTGDHSSYKECTKNPIRM